MVLWPDCRFHTSVAVNVKREAIRGKLSASPKLLALLEGEEARDQGALDRLFGEALPSGLVLQEVAQ